MNTATTPTIADPILAALATLTERLASLKAEALIVADRGRGLARGHATQTEKDRTAANIRTVNDMLMSALLQLEEF